MDRSDVLEMARKIGGAEKWCEVENEVAMFCYAAGLLEEFENTDDKETFEDVIFRASESLCIYF